MPIRIQINSASISLNPESTIGWDSYAGLSVSCVKSNFLYLIKDGPLLQSGVCLEGLGNSSITPEAEGPLLVQCIDPITKNKHFKVDPNAVYAPVSYTHLTLPTICSV